MIAALFDADGTLYSAQMGRGLLKYAETHGRRNIVRRYYASLIPGLLLSKLKLASLDGLQRNIIERLGWLIKGWDQQEAAAAFSWVAQEYLLPTRRAHVIQRLQDHQAQGHLVLIVSGMFMPCLEQVGKGLGVTHLIGTQIEMQAGRYTGRIIPPVIKGADKVGQAQEYFSSRKFAIDWAASFAYGNSFSDQDLLNLVGHPVAVHPEPRLRALAQQRSWEILETQPYVAGMA